MHVAWSVQMLRNVPNLYSDFEGSVLHIRNMFKRLKDNHLDSRLFRALFEIRNGKQRDRGTGFQRRIWLTIPYRDVLWKAGLHKAVAKFNSGSISCLLWRELGLVQPPQVAVAWKCRVGST